MACFVLYICILAYSQTKLHFYLNCQHSSRISCVNITTKIKKKTKKYLRYSLMKPTTRGLDVGYCHGKWQNMKHDYTDMHLFPSFLLFSIIYITGQGEREIIQYFFLYFPIKSFYYLRI